MTRRARFGAWVDSCPLTRTPRQGLGCASGPDAKVHARRNGRALASPSTRRFNVVLRATTAVTRVVTFSTTVSAAGVKPKTVVVKAKPIRIKPSRNASAESPTG